MRSIIFFVNYICATTGKEQVLFSTNNYQEAEKFCLNYEGQIEEIYIRKIFFQASKEKKNE